MQNKKKGFGLLELMLVLVVLSTLAINFFSSMSKKKPNIIKESVSELNDMIQKAYIKSTVEKKIYQIRLFFKNGILESYGLAFVKNIKNIAQEDITVENQIKFKHPISLKTLIINGFNEMAKGNPKETWILMYPEGYIQEVNLSIIDSENSIIENFYIHPFFCELMYED